MTTQAGRNRRLVINLIPPVALRASPGGAEIPNATPMVIYVNARGRTAARVVAIVQIAAAVAGVDVGDAATRVS